MFSQFLHGTLPRLWYAGKTNKKSRNISIKPRVLPGPESGQKKTYDRAATDRRPNAVGTRCWSAASAWWSAIHRTPDWNCCRTRWHWCSKTLCRVCTALDKCPFRFACTLRSDWRQRLDGKFSGTAAQRLHSLFSDMWQLWKFNWHCVNVCRTLGDKSWTAHTVIDVSWAGQTVQKWLLDRQLAAPISRLAMRQWTMVVGMLVVRADV